MNIKLIAADIDGTLVDSDKKISAETKEAIFKFIDDGGVFAIASGRSVKGIMQYAAELELNKRGGYLIAFNGSIIIDAKTGKPICETMIPPKLIPEILKSAAKNNVSIASYKDDKAITKDSKDKYFLMETSMNNLEIVYVDDLYKELNYPVPKFLLTDEPEILEKVEENMKAELDCVNIFRSEPYYLEIVPKELDKGMALRKLCEHLNIDISQTLSCGDGYNDIPLIKQAGIGVAMANAQPEVKKVADFITLSNDENGVAYAINKFCEI